GEGGLLALDREDWFEWAWSYKDHGKGYHTVFHKVHPPGYQWLHDRFGTNWRMTEMQAAIGRLQLRDLEASVTARGRKAARGRDRLGHLARLRLPAPREGARHAYYRLYGYVVPEALKPGWDRDRIQDELAAAGLFIKVGSCSEVYREEAFVNAGLAPAEPLPVAREIGETVLGFPVHPTLTEETIDAAANLVAEVVTRATR